MHERIRIYTNPSGQNKLKEQAKTLLGKLPDSSLKPLTFPLEEIPDEVETVIVAGGDGSVKTVTEALSKQEKPGLLLIMPAGSQNGLYNSLLDTDSTIRLEQLLGKSSNHIPSFRPGQISGELFNHVAEITKVGLLEHQLDERFRKLVPRRVRSFLAAGITMEKTTNHEAKVLMLSPYIGSLKVFPDQKLYSDYLTMLSIQTNNPVTTAVKLAALSTYFLMAKQPPVTLARFSSQPSFLIQDSCGEINVDGEVRIPSKNGPLLIHRSTRSIQAAALLLN